MNQLKNHLSQANAGMKPEANNSSRRVFYARWIIVATGFIISILLAQSVLKNQLKLQEASLGYFHSNNLKASMQRIANQSPKKYEAQLSKEIESTEKALKAFLPKQSYIVVNTTGNNFRLYDANGKPLREGLVSTGSFTVLKAGNDRQWMFKTPRGQLKVLKKTKDPVWKRPDWAFIEEGLKVPSPNHPSRFEYGTLGDYSMSLGDGYLIHGTL
ncbi:MAG: L,D-transpeptidase, partial [Bacteroidales bacterium]|nr:L,D-transpeptidase [Bacteroidales bacterium]